MIRAELLIALNIAISCIKLAQGFDIDLKKLAIRQDNKLLVIHAVLTGIFWVPVLFLILILIFQPNDRLNDALIIMAIAPASDLSVRQVATLGGDVALATDIQVFSALTSIITTPLLLELFALILGLNLDIKFTHVVEQVAVAQFIPMCIGLSLRKFFPSYAWLTKYIMAFATSLLVAMLIIIIVENHHFFTEFPLRAYLMVAGATASAFLMGVIFAGKNTKRQITLAIEAGLRNPGLAYLIASENFIPEKVTSAMAPYLATSISVIIACTFLLKFIHKQLQH